MKHILITGGAGFIGSHLVDRLLTDGYAVTTIDDFNDFYEPSVKRRNIEKHLLHPCYTLCEGDIRDRAFLQDVFKENSFEAVVHLAARAGVRPSLAEPVLYQEVNIAGTQNIFECCRAFDVKKCLFASSSSVYGINSKIPFFEEDNIAQPISPYAATKAAGELLAHVYSHLYDIQIICLRFFTVYGPRQRPDLAIHKFTNLIENGRQIPVFGNGDTQRDYTYIDDIVAGLVGALHYRATPFEIVNLGNSQIVALRTLIQVIEHALGKKAAIKWLPAQPGDVPITYADTSKAKRLFGFAPNTPITEGVGKFVAWYRETSGSGHI